uniref:Putative conserved protein PMP2 n=1 Tax=Moniliophthora roreri TaxID=221103 RepID=A0A0W0FAV9_MONRR
MFRKSSDPDLISLSVPFLALHLSGSAGLLLLISTFFFSTRVRRPPTIINFWITWIIYSVSYIPPQMLCRVQSAMVHGAPPMVATAGLLAMLQVRTKPYTKMKTSCLRLSTPFQMWHTYWDHIRYPYRLPDAMKERSKTIYLLPLLGLPYIVFLIFAISSAVYANGRLHALTAPTGLYCTMNADVFSRYSIPLYCMVIAILLGGFEVVIVLQWWWARHTVDNIILMKRETEKACLFRLLLFNLSLIVMSCTIIYMADTLSPWPYMAQAALPLAAALVFGTQSDMLAVWSFWKRKSKRKPGLQVVIPSARPGRAFDSVSYSATGISMRTPQVAVSRPGDVSMA